MFITRYVNRISKNFYFQCFIFNPPQRKVFSTIVSPLTHTFSTGKWKIMRTALIPSVDAENSLPDSAQTHAYMDRKIIVAATNVYTRIVLVENQNSNTLNKTRFRIKFYLITSGRRSVTKGSVFFRALADDDDNVTVAANINSVDSSTGYVGFFSSGVCKYKKNFNLIIRFSFLTLIHK